MPGKSPLPVCGSRPEHWIDDGTSNLQRSPTPGTLNAVANTTTYAEFIAWAKSEIQNAIIWEMPLYSFWKPNAASSLSADFFKGYISGNGYSDELINRASKEIGDSPEFDQLQNEVETEIRRGVKTNVIAPPLDDAVRRLAQTYLRNRRVTKGIEFRGPLNPVIGGVDEDVEVHSCTAAIARDGTLTYTLTVTFTDHYKFAGNARSGGKKGTIADQPEYDAQRKRWAELIGKGEYGTIITEYKDVFWKLGSKLSAGTAFASLMYALDAKCMTPPPLRWTTAPIPMTGSAQTRLTPTQGGIGPGLNTSGSSGF